MSSTNIGRGRGRARAVVNTQEPPEPSFSNLASSSSSDTAPDTNTQMVSSPPVPTHLASVPTASTVPKPTGRGRGAVVSKRVDTPIESISSSMNQTSLSESTVPNTREIMASSQALSTISSPTLANDSETEATLTATDEIYKVSTLKKIDFSSVKRAPKPSQGGTIGRPVNVVTNYFSITKFPKSGLIYRYQVRILDRMNEEVHRIRRRLLYQTWLDKYLNEHQELDGNRMAFDNQSLMVSYNQPLVFGEEQKIRSFVKGPDKRNRHRDHIVEIFPVGDVVNLEPLNNLDDYYKAINESLVGSEELLMIRQLLSIALHERASRTCKFAYGRSYFTMANDQGYNAYDLGKGKALWLGYYSCLTLCNGEHKLAMNCDVKFSSFTKRQQFIEFLIEIMATSPSGKQSSSGRRNPRMRGENNKIAIEEIEYWLDPGCADYEKNIKFIEKQIKNHRIKSRNADKPIVYTIKSLGKSAITQTFSWKKAQRDITVADYFFEQYGYQLEHPTLPVIVATNKSFVPMETVDFEPVRQKKLTEDQIAAICRYAQMKPNEYAQQIQNIRRDPDKQCFEQDPFVRAWNMNVDARMIEIPARVLPTPTIKYTESFKIDGDRVRTKGVWESPSSRFTVPCNFPDNWAMLNFSPLSQAQCEDFYFELSRIAQNCGINCPPPHVYQEFRINDNDMSRTMASISNLLRANSNCRFCFVILPENDSQRKTIYNQLKKMFELTVDYNFGIPSQMVKYRNAMIGTRRDPNVWDRARLQNILLKINPKLNGTNWSTEVQPIIERFFAKGHRIMYVGIDLSHLLVSGTSRLSSVAVVASADDLPNRYFKEVYQQKRSNEVRRESIEMVISLKEIMKSLIMKYTDYRGFPPTAIVIYRDGISEGEFDSVFDAELTSVRDACMELSTAYRPYLTYIVVNKRHHTRFFPKNNTQSNVESGTVVDSSQVTNPLTYDFFLCSQHGALGTTRPTHYHVLYDDNKLTPDQVQTLTYALCFTYARCTRAVAIPAPVKYADLLATRAAIYISDYSDSDTESVSSQGTLAINTRTQGAPQTISERIELSSKLLAECPFFI